MGILEFRTRLLSSLGLTMVFIKCFYFTSTENMLAL